MYLIRTALILVLLAGVNCLEWSSPDGTSLKVVHACPGDTLSLPFALTLASGDVIENIQWYVSGVSQVLIATEAGGNFIVMPGFASRVQKRKTAGIDLENAQTLDSGNYSVEVIARSAQGEVVTLWRSVLAYVSDGPETVGGVLEVTQSEKAEYDNFTDQFHVLLKCGTFTTTPHLDVVWTTPSGQQTPSSGYRNESYLLSLPNPVTGGSYSCTLPPALTCHSHHHHNNNNISNTSNSTVFQATVTVDRLEAKMAVLDAEQYRLRQKNENLTSSIAGLHSEMDGLLDKNQALELELNRLKDKTHSLKSALMYRRVSFHAQLSNDTSQTQGNPLTLTNVVHNQGLAYDPSSGVFTAPHNATYCFLVTSESSSTAIRDASVSLMVGNSEVGYVELYQESDARIAGPIHAVLHLTAGQRVYVRSTYLGWYKAKATTFSGFLLSPDSLI